MKIAINANFKKKHKKIPFYTKHIKKRLSLRLSHSASAYAWVPPSVRVPVAKHLCSAFLDSS